MQSNVHAWMMHGLQEINTNWVFQLILTPLLQEYNDLEHLEQILDEMPYVSALKVRKRLKARSIIMVFRIDNRVQNLFQFLMNFFCSSVKIW